MRAVLVTGGSGGIGAAVAQRFAQSGDRVALHYVSNEAGAEVTRRTGPNQSRIDRPGPFGAPRKTSYMSLPPPHAVRAYKPGTVLTVTYPPRRTLQPADSSVLLTVRGLPSWGAILVALVVGGLGMVAGHSGGQYTVGWIFGGIFTIGIVLATLAVRRGSLFTAMVQAPIILTFLVFCTFRFFGGQGTIFSASKIVTSFPVMAVATGVALLLALVRIIAQPLRGAGAPSSAQSYSARG